MKIYFYRPKTMRCYCTLRISAFVACYIYLVGCIMSAALIVFFPQEFSNTDRKYDFFSVFLLVLEGLSASCKILLIIGLYARNTTLILIWLVLISILWKLDFVFFIFLLINQLVKKRDELPFSLIILFTLQIVWLVCVFIVWKYWNVLRELQGLPAYLRTQLNTGHGRASRYTIIKLEDIDFETMSISEFNRLLHHSNTNGRH